MKKIIALVIALTLVLAMPVLAQAKTSPSGSVEIKVTVKDTNGGTVDSSENEDLTYTIKATPSKNYEFVKWDISGEFTFVKGDINSPEITIDYTSDVTVTPVWREIGTSSSAGPIDSSNGSPQTADNTNNVLPIALFVLLAMFAVAGVVIIRNKNTAE